MIAAIAAALACQGNTVTTPDIGVPKLPLLS
jgi:hypothetical protein